MLGLKIEIGKRYILRNGLVTEPIELSKNGTNYIYQAKVMEDGYTTPSVLSWLKDGVSLTRLKESKKDIVGIYS
jgi:hypothetical protein